MSHLRGQHSGPSSLRLRLLIARNFASGILISLCLSLTGCLLDDITAETAEIQDRSKVIFQKIEGLSKEQQMIIYETRDLNGHAELVPRLTSQLELARDELENQKALLELERKQLEVSEAYLKKHLPTIPNS